MNQQITLFGDTVSIADLAGRAISAVVNGDISPIDAHIQISRMENAIKQFKDDAQVRDITLRELSKYGKSHPFGRGRIGCQVRLFNVRRQPAERYVQDAGGSQGGHQRT